MYDAYMRLCYYEFYWLVPPARLFHSAQLFIELQVVIPPLAYSY